NSRFRNDQIRRSRTIALYHTFECLCHFVVADKRAELSVAGKRKPLSFKWLAGCCRAAFEEQGFHFRDLACHRQPQILSAEFALNMREFFRRITCTLLALLRKCPEINGAGEGNRTLVCVV